MGFSIKEIQWLLNDETDGWQKYRIKTKLKEINSMLNTISQSPKAFLFTEELIQIIMTANKIAYIIDSNIIINELKKKE